MTLESLIADAYRYAFSLCSQRSTAEDLVQEAWLRVVERYGSDIERAVLYRTIRNLYIDRWRREKRFPSDSYEYGKVLAVDESGYHHDPALNAALLTLGDLERETLFLAVIEGYTAQEIAALTDSPRGSVLSRLHRAKRKLAEILASDESSDRTGTVVDLHPRSTRDGKP